MFRFVKVQRPVKREGTGPVRGPEDGVTIRDPIGLRPSKHALTEGETMKKNSDTNATAAQLIDASFQPVEVPDMDISELLESMDFENMDKELDALGADLLNGIGFDSEDFARFDAQIFELPGFDFDALPDMNIIPLDDQEDRPGVKKC